MVLVVKNPLTNPGDIETQVQSLDREDLLEEGMTTHASILGWRIVQKEDSGRLQFMESQKVINK